MMKMTSYIALFNILCFTAMANDQPVEGQVTQTPGQENEAAGSKSAQANEGDLDEEPFTKEDFKREFFDDLKYETSRLQLRWSFEEIYALQGESMHETYLASKEREHTEDKITDAWQDAFLYASYEAGKHTPLWLTLEEWFEKFGSEPFVDREKESDFESRNRTRLGVLFGKGKIKPGYEISDRPKALVEFRHYNGATELVYDEDTGEIKKQPVKIRHRLSFKLTDVFDAMSSGVVKYEIDHISGWLGMNFEYDIEDNTARFYFDGFEIHPGKYLYGGITYYGEENGWGFRNDHMVAPENSLTFTVGMHGTFTDFVDLGKALMPWNWHSSYQKQQKQMRYTYSQTQDDLQFAAAR